MSESKQKIYLNNSEDKFRLFQRVPLEEKANFAAALRKTNVNRMYAFALYIIGIQILLNLLNILIPNDYQNSNIMVYVALSLITLTLGIVYFILLLLVKKDKIKSARIQDMLIFSLLYLYLGIQMVFSFLNIITSANANSYIIAILIIGVFPILRPQQSIISIVTLFIVFFFSLFLTRGYSDSWSAILVTDTWTNLIIITVITICFSVMIYNMYVSNYLKTISLAKSNADLAEQNDALEDFNQQLETIAKTDTITGIANRYAFSRDFERVWQYSLSEKQKLAVAIADIDFFKDYNDKFGHLQGDECLKEVATSLHDSFRRNQDIVCRFGGEEFLIVFNANNNNAKELVEKARQNVEDLHIPHAVDRVSPYVTISIGVCVVNPAEQQSNVQALQAADEALYAAKNSGRNKTVYKELA